MVSVVSEIPVRNSTNIGVPSSNKFLPICFHQHFHIKSHTNMIRDNDLSHSSPSSAKIGDQTLHGLTNNNETIEAGGAPGALTDGADAGSHQKFTLVDSLKWVVLVGRLLCFHSRSDVIPQKALSKTSQKG